MTNVEAKVYLQYIKVVLAMVGRSDEDLIEAIDLADSALGEETLYGDPRFEKI